MNPINWWFEQNKLIRLLCILPYFFAGGIVCAAFKAAVGSWYMSMPIGFLGLGLVVVALLMPREENWMNPRGV